MLPQLSKLIARLKTLKQRHDTQVKSDLKTHEKEMNITKTNRNQTGHLMSENEEMIHSDMDPSLCSLPKNEHSLSLEKRDLSQSKEKPIELSQLYELESSELLDKSNTIQNINEIFPQEFEGN